jgi:hypothetical protein
MYRQSGVVKGKFPKTIILLYYIYTHSREGMDSTYYEWLRLRMSNFNPP